MIRRVHPGWRFVYAPFLVLTALSAVILYVVATDTEDMFAWTVQPDVAAAFLGAGYASGFVLVLLTTFERAWASARIAMVTVFAFTVCTLGTTLAHTDRFHFDEGGLPEVAAWFWLAIYVVVPAAMLVMFAVQRRVPGDDPPVRRPLPLALSALLVVEAAVLGAAGLALLVDPAWVEPAWPWALTPLTGRAVGAWCLPLGLAALLAVRERDARRLRAAAVTYVVLGVLHAVALVRFRDDIRWGEPLTWAYLVVLASMVLSGVWGRVLARGTGAHAAAPARTGRRSRPTPPAPVMG